MSMRMMKDLDDGTLDIVDVDDADVQTAVGQGFKPFVNMYDDVGEEQVVDYTQIDDAIKKGFSMGEMKNQYRPTKLEAFQQGGVSGIPFGSEAVAAGRTFLNDKGFDANLNETLEDQRVAREAHPATTIAGGLTSGLPYVGIPGVKATNLKGALLTGAGLGATYGAGNMQGDLLDRSVGATSGAMMGAGLSAAPWAVHNAAPVVQGIKAGATQLGESPLAIPKALGAARGTYQEVKQAKDFLDKTGGAVGLFDEGPNAIKEWATKKAVSHGPNQLDQENLLRVYNLGLRKRQEARRFDPRAASEAVLPNMRKMESSLGSETGSAYRQLQEKVPGEIDLDSVDYLSPFSSFEAQADVAGVPERTRSIVNQAAKIVEEGLGVKKLGLQQGAWEAVDAAEKLKRLHAARRYLGSEISWTAKESFPGANMLLKDMRGEIDDILKQSPSQVKADAMYSEYKTLQKKISDTVSFGESGGVDKYKLARTFSDSDTANRFRDNIDQMEAFVESYAELMTPQDASDVIRTIKQLKESSAIAGNKRDIQALRNAQGPSSPAVDALQSSMEKRGFHGDFIQSPAGALNAADQSLESMAQKYYNMPYENLGQQEKKRLTQALVREWADKKLPDIEKQRNMDKFINKGVKK